MSDNRIDIVFGAVTDEFKSGLNAVNDALGYVKLHVQNTQSPISELFATMERSSDSAIAAMMKGTENWHQATLKIIQDLEIKFVQLNANKLLHELATNVLGLEEVKTRNAAEIVSNETKNAAITASNAETANVSAGSHAAQLIKQIGSDAAAAYAGVYANMSPVFGPAAAIPAGIAYASVAAMEGLVSLDVGAWNLGSDMIAQLHQGEMVVPQNFAQGLRDGGGLGGGDNYTININAIDTQTGAQFLKNNAANIASALSSQVRSFNRNVPAWKG